MVGFQICCHHSLEFDGRILLVAYTCPIYIWDASKDDCGSTREDCPFNDAMFRADAYQFFRTVAYVFMSMRILSRSMSTDVGFGSAAAITTIIYCQSIYAAAGKTSSLLSFFCCRCYRFRGCYVVVVVVFQTQFCIKPCAQKEL